MPAIHPSAFEEIRMSLKPIQTDAAPAAVGPYNQAIVSGELIFCSGQIALDPAKGELVTDDVAGQTTQAIRNLAAVLEAAGSSLDRVVKTTVFLTDMGDFAAVNAAYEQAFAGHKPARSAFQVGALPKGARVEVEAIATR
jgi:2-iminobutanoate/2-iminopropanoate deaminase